MTWSYGDPAAEDLWAVRLLLGDIFESDQLLQDEEINWLLTENTDIYGAAAEGARMISAQFARLADTKSIGDLSVSYAQRSARFVDLAKRLDERAERAGLIPTPYAAIRTADREADDDDTSLITRRFSRNQFGEPGD